MLKTVSSWLIYYSLFLLTLQMYKPSSCSSTASLSLLISLHLFFSLVMATVFSHVVFALQHAASSHCPAVTRAHISTGRPAVLYWKSHCYATYVLLPAAPTVRLFNSLSPPILHVSLWLCLLWAPSRSHPQQHCQKKAHRFYWKTCSSLVIKKRQFLWVIFG